MDIMIQYTPKISRGILGLGQRGEGGGIFMVLPQNIFLFGAPLYLMQSLIKCTVHHFMI